MTRRGFGRAAYNLKYVMLVIYYRAFLFNQTSEQKAAGPLNFGLSEDTKAHSYAIS